MQNNQQISCSCHCQLSLQTKNIINHRRKKRQVNFHEVIYVFDRETPKIRVSIFIEIKMTQFIAITSTAMVQSQFFVWNDRKKESMYSLMLFVLFLLCKDVVCCQNLIFGCQNFVFLIQVIRIFHDQGVLQRLTY